MLRDIEIMLRVTFFWADYKSSQNSDVSSESFQSSLISPFPLRNVTIDFYCIQMIAVSRINEYIFPMLML